MATRIASIEIDVKTLSYKENICQLQSQYYGGPQVSRQNFLSHGKTFFLTAKLSFSKQNTLSHGKTFFLTAELSFSRQNFLSQSKAVISATLVGLLTLETWILHVSSVHSDSQWQCGWKMIWRRMEVNLKQFYGEPLCPSFEDDAKQSGIQDCYSGL